MRARTLVAAVAVALGAGGLIASASTLLGAEDERASLPVAPLSDEDIAARADQVEIAELSDAERVSAVETARIDPLVDDILTRSGVQSVEVVPSTNAAGGLVGATVHYTLAKPFAGSVDWLAAAKPDGSSAEPAFRSLPVRKMTVLDVEIALPSREILSVLSGVGTEYARPPVGTELTLADGTVVTLTEDNFSYDSDRGVIILSDEILGTLDLGE